MYFHTMAHDAATTMGSLRCQGMDGALDTVERVGTSGHNDLKGLIVLVAADFTLPHGSYSPFVAVG